MDFRATFRKTLLDLTGWKSMLAMVLTTTVVSFIIVLLQWHPEEYWPEQVITHYALNRLLLTSFFWISGFFLAFLVVSKAAAYIAREASEGTLLILVSKPVNRRNIILAKLSALMLWAILLTAIITVLLVLVMRLWFDLTDDTLFILLEAVPWLLLYSALVSLFFGTVTMALSSLTKNVIPIMVVMACLIMFVFLLGPVLRYRLIDSSDAYLNYHLYFWDMSYHVSNAAVPFQQQASGGLILPEQVRWMSSDYVLPPARELSIYSPVVPRLYPAFALSLIKPLTSLLILAVISISAIRLAIFAMERKDVH